MKYAKKVWTVIVSCTYPLRMTDHLTPYDVIETLIGRAETIGPICGFDEKTPYRWRFGSKARAAGDIPSAPIMRKLKAHSDAHDLGLTYAHLVEGASRHEVDEILARREAGDASVAAE